MGFHQKKDWWGEVYGGGWKERRHSSEGREIACS